ncbi:MAG: UDP-N-acetylmuramate dehydrogenase [Planctomycetota bacterium]|nr:UDP-N-acetylmuramate dehydrogenase [Planctomycetota bacterium]
MSTRWRINWSAEFGGATFERDADMRRFTTIGVGGPADVLARPADAGSLAGLVKRASEFGVPLRILGGGSNLLVGDEGVRGLVIAMDAEPFGRIEFSGTRVFAGAGLGLQALARKCAANGLSGLEGLAGIPGTVGGALRGNAGGRHGAIGSAVRSVLCMSPDGEILVRKTAECGFEYRRSSLGGVIILGAEFELSPADPEDITLRTRAVYREKAATQPLRERSAGCFFKNPPGMAAGWMIDRMGFKGRRVGGAMVSPVHANFIVNAGGATCGDVVMLAREIRRRAKIEFGADLELEVETWGIPEEAWVWK